MKPLLHIYLTTWNNQEVLKDTITWYRDLIPDCKITVYDNMSTDMTIEMCTQMNCQVISFNTGGTMNEKILMQIRELCWLNPEHDSTWVLCCDDDEMGMITPELLENAEWNVCQFQGYEMFGQEGDTLEDMRYGLTSEGYSKKILFKRDEIQAMNFGAGSHNANPIPKEGFEIKYSVKEVPLYHTKWGRGWDKGVSRQKSIAPRVDEESKRKNWNFHFALPERLEEGQTGLNHWGYYSDGFQMRQKVR